MTIFLSFCLSGFSIDIDQHLYMDIYIYIIYVYADIYVCVHPHPDQETGGGGGPPARRDVGPPSPLVVPPAPSQQAKRAELAGTTSSTNCPPAKKKARARHNKPKLAHEWCVTKGSLEVKLPTYGKMQPDRAKTQRDRGRERREKRERESLRRRKIREGKIQEKATPTARNLQNLIRFSCCSPCARALSSSSFGIASQESWSVNLDAAPHTKDLILMEAAYFADE